MVNDGDSISSTSSGFLVYIQFEAWERDRENQNEN